MDWTKPSKTHFQYIRSLPMEHLPSGLDYQIRIEGNTLYIIFAESNALKYDNDWTGNLNFFPETFDMYSGIKAHRGIAEQYFSIRQVIMDYLYGGTVKQIYVSGFSLGGALTVAAVEDIGYHIDRDNLDVAVFGISYEAPRFFCPSKIVKKAIKDRLILVKTHWDPVVHLPFRLMVMPIRISPKPFRLSVVHPKQWVSFWADNITTTWVGKPWRILPIQHRPAQVERALREKYGE